MAIAAGAGESQHEIALGLGITVPTLRKHFRHELTVGAYQCRADVVMAIFQAALRGKVTAIRSYLKT